MMAFRVPCSSAGEQLLHESEVLQKKLLKEDSNKTYKMRQDYTLGSNPKEAFNRSW